MERKDIITTWPFKVDDNPVEKQEVILTGSPTEVAILALGLKGILASLETVDALSKDGSRIQATSDFISKLIAQVEEPADIEKVELGPDSITEEFLQEVYRGN